LSATGKRGRTCCARRWRWASLQAGGPDSSARSIERQRALKAEWTAKGQPHKAAVPGTSNHGWAIAVDIPFSDAQAWICHAVLAATAIACSLPLPNRARTTAIEVTFHIGAAEAAQHAAPRRASGNALSRT